MSELTRWLAGQGKPSIGVFLRLVDVLIEEGKKSRLGRAAGDIIAFPSPPETPGS